MRLLVVDDDPYVRLLCSLELPEAEVLEASGVSDGLDAVADDHPDVVLVDRRLGGTGDGIELVRLIRNLPAGSTVPVIVVTAGHDEAERANVMTAGADEYVPKPIDPDDLRVRISRLVQLTGEERAERRASLLEQISGGLYGDPEPPPRRPEDPVPPAKRRWLRRRD